MRPVPDMPQNSLLGHEDLFKIQCFLLCSSFKKTQKNQLRMGTFTFMVGWIFPVEKHFLNSSLEETFSPQVWTYFYRALLDLICICLFCKASGVLASNSNWLNFIPDSYPSPWLLDYDLKLIKCTGQVIVLYSAWLHSLFIIWYNLSQEYCGDDLQKVWDSLVYLGLVHCFHTLLFYRDICRSMPVLYYFFFSFYLGPFYFFKRNEEKREMVLDVWILDTHSNSFIDNR